MTDARSDGDLTPEFPSDGHWMREAVRLAALGGRATRPNPQVGCVLVRDDVIVATGYHAKCGGPHAEAAALAAAGAQAKGSTAYVTLEPCNHHGRTPPCAQALIDAGVARVVIGHPDPNPLATGGATRLRAAGVVVREGVELTACADVAEVFLVGLRTKRAFVQLKLAATLDGFTAARDGSSQWITGEPARIEVHRMRAEADAVLVGSGTALADDPRLDVRHISAVKQPLRVVLDRRLRLPITSHLADVTSSPTLVFVDEPDVLSSAKAIALTERGVDVACVAAARGTSWLTSVLQALRARGVHHVLCEGGATLAGALLRQGLVDRLDLFQASCLLGAGTPLWPDLGISSLADARKLRWRTPRLVGDDMWITARPLG